MAWRKPPKYNAQRTEIDGIRFASKREALRYQDLKIMERAGYISKLTCQVRFPILIQNEKICTYVADFVYYDKNGNYVVEDTKGFRTPEYKLKAKLMRAIYDITILET